MGKKWSKTEEAYLRDNFDNLTLDELSTNLGRGRRGTQTKLYSLGLRNFTAKRWTKEDEELLLELYPTKGVKYVAKKLGRTLDSVSGKCRKLKISKQHKWQKLDHEYVIDQYVIKNRSVNEISEELNVVFWDVCTILNKNNIPTQKKEPKVGKDHGKWRGFGDISRTHWNDIKWSAKDRNIVFDIDIDFGWRLFLEQERKCALSGVDIKFSIKSGGWWKNTTASLDRIDSSKFYTKDNVQWIHKRLQFVKGSLMEDELLSWCKLIVKHKGKI